MAASAGSWRDRIRKAFLARDEGELENVMSDLPENAELHLHVGGPNGAAPGDNGGVMTPAMMDAALKIRDAEMEEIWRAIGNIDKALRPRLKKFRTSRDAGFKAPQRDARRARLGIRDEDPDDDDDKGKTGDDDDKDDDDKSKSGDEFRDPPQPGGSGNRSILPGFQMEAPPGTADAAFKTADSPYLKDSAWMAPAYQEAIAIGEVLIPGIRVPTFDGAVAPQKTHDALCAFRANVIDLAWNHPETRELIEDASGGRFTDVKSMSCQQVRDLFVAVGALKMRLNDANRSNGMPLGQPLAPIAAMTIGDLNKANREFYAKQPRS